MGASLNFIVSDFGMQFFSAVYFLK